MDKLISTPSPSQNAPDSTHFTPTVITSSSAAPLLWLVFFLSGVAGISYQLTWVRYVTHLFQASTPAISVTVSLFFIGMALGAALGGWWFDRSRFPLRTYALLELSIGCMALLVPWGFQAIQRWIPYQDGSVNYIWLFLATSVVLLIPTTLLGAVFPAMAAVLRNVENPTRSTSLFYGFNTIGSVIGCVVIAFWWLPAFGQAGTSYGMAYANVAIAFILLGLHAFSLKSTAQPTPPQEVPTRTFTDSTEHIISSSPKNEGKPFPFGLAVLVAGTSGFLAIGIEVLWTRALALSFPLSAYIFSFVLAAYLVGIALGSLWMGALAHKRTPRWSWLVWLYTTVAFGAWLTLFLFPRLNDWSLWFFREQWLSGWQVYLGWTGLATVCVMLPTTLAMGAALPLLIGLATQEQATAGRVAGRIYASNTLGGVVGSLWATFWLMPRLGVGGSLLLLGIGYLLISLVIARAFRKEASSAVNWSCRWVPIGLLVGCGCMLLTGTYPQVDPLKQQSAKKILFYKDSASATVALTKSKDGIKSLSYNNIKGLRQSGKELAKLQYRLGHLSMLLQPKAKQVLVMGIGNGAMLSALSEHTPKKLDCLENDGLLLKYLKHFSTINHQVWREPIVRILQKNEGTFLNRNKQRYPLIIRNMNVPTEPGFAELHSLETYRGISKKLTKGGLFITWLPLTQLGANDLAIIIQTFVKVFPKAEGWIGQWNTRQPVLGLVSQNIPKHSDTTKFSEEYLHFLTKETLARAPLVEPTQSGQVEPQLGTLPGDRKSGPPTEDYFEPEPGPFSEGKSTSAGEPSVKPLTIMQRRLLTNQLLRRWAGKTRANTLHRPTLEFSIPRSIFRASLSKQSLSKENIQKIRSLRTLQGTPWK